MLSRNSLQGAKHIQLAARLSPKRLSTAATLARASRITCAVILISTAASLELYADDPPKPPDPCNDPTLKSTANWPPPAKPPADAPKKPPTPPPTKPAADQPKPPSTLEDQTKAALAREWTDEAGVDQMLAAFKLLTSSVDLHPKSRKDLNKDVLTELIKGDGKGDPVDKDLYGSAMGNLDDNDDQTIDPAPINLLDALAKANNLTKATDDDKRLLYEANLFACTQKLIDKMSETGPGKHALVDINNSFGAKNDHNYVALYRLLRAYPPAKVHDDNIPSYVYALEIFRAAFENNTDRLAKKVAAKIAAKK